MTYHEFNEVINFVRHSIYAENVIIQEMFNPCTMECRVYLKNKITSEAKAVFLEPCIDKEQAVNVLLEYCHDLEMSYKMISKKEYYDMKEKIEKQEETIELQQSLIETLKGIIERNSMNP